MKPAAYVYKRRQVLGRGRPSLYRPRGSIRFSEWQRVAEFATFEEARARQLADNVGLCDRGVFYRGRRLTDNTGKARA